VILKLRIKSAEEWRELAPSENVTDPIFVPTTDELKAGQQVILEVASNLLPNKVMIRGLVQTWRPALPRMRVRAGATVEFDPEEAPKRDFVLQTMRGARAPSRRRKHTRIPIRVPVKVREANQLDAADAELREISVSGGLLTGAVQPPVGTDVVMEIAPPGSEAPFDLSGRVVYHAGPNQTGVRLLYREGGGSRRLRELVRRFKTL